MKSCLCLQCGVEHRACPRQRYQVRVPSPALPSTPLLPASPSTKALSLPAWPAPVSKHRSLMLLKTGTRQTK